LKKFVIPKFRVFRPIFGLHVVLPKVACFKRPLNQSTTLSNHCLLAYLTHGSDKNNLIVCDSTTQKILETIFSSFFLRVSTIKHLISQGRGLHQRMQGEMTRGRDQQQLPGPGMSNASSVMGLGIMPAIVPTRR